MDLAIFGHFQVSSQRSHEVISRTLAGEAQRVVCRGCNGSRYTITVRAGVGIPDNALTGGYVA